MQPRHARTRSLAPLAGALMLGLSTQAGAVSLNPDGQGQVLLFPYYTVNGGLVTVMSLTNHTDQVKAVKVRFLEAQNSREVFDFNLYLSPFDQWTGALIDAGHADGPAILLSDDTSCIAPAQIPAGGMDFRNYQYTGANADGGPAGVDRTRDGHIEVIDMGVVGDGQGAAPFELATAATHNPELLDEQGRVLPNDCDKIRAAWNSGGVWRVAPNTDDDVSPPIGGLSGSAAIVDVAQGIAYPYAATAIEGFFERPDLAFSPLHAFPGSILPNLAQAEDLIADPEGGTATALIVDGNTVRRMSFEAMRFRAVSALLMRTELSGEVNTHPGMGASTEWVINFPTRGLHLAQPGNLRRPFIASFSGESGAPEPFDFMFWDRETRTGIPGEEPIWGLPPPGWPPMHWFLRYSSSILAINQVPEEVSRVLRAPPDRVLPVSLCDGLSLDQVDCPEGPDVLEGWLRIQLGNDGVDVGTDGVEHLSHFMLGDIANEDGTFPLFAGLPALGLAFSSYVNEQIEPGVLANYSTLQPLGGGRFAAPVLGVNAAGAPIPVPPPAADEAP